MIDKIMTVPLSGFKDRLPNEAIVLDRIFSNIKKSFMRFGFAPIETPMIERKAILCSNTNTDVKKQIFNIEDKDAGLRFDQTIPLARYIINNKNEIPLPGLLFQIGKVFRGERPQSGRLREFYQCDYDIISTSTPIDEQLKQDAYTINLGIVAFVNVLNLKQLDKLIQDRDIALDVNNIAIYFLIFDILNIKDNDTREKILIAIDKTDYVSKDTFTDINLDENSIMILEKFSNIKFDFLGSDIKTHFEPLLKLLGDNKEIITIIDNFTKLQKILSTYRDINLGDDKISRSIKSSFDKIKFSGKLVRGQSYYSGIVFEGKIDSLKSSVLGGGRYNKLTENLDPKTKLEGVGASLGISRVFEYISNKITGEQVSSPILLFCEYEDNDILLKIQKDLKMCNTKIFFSTDFNKMLKYIKNEVSINVVIISKKCSTDECQFATVSNGKIVERETLPIKDIEKYIMRDT
ncbi:MAG: histidine--tRNA ligase family protein [Alphaproteobacteria bacterium]|nr:histidine--tRNA ligase family protein [Alphaproteobacteria bacterium]MBL0717711.1 histidine--tRNA ligase family protein [Alphaproteobacteria bacterium]